MIRIVRAPCPSCLSAASKNRSAAYRKREVVRVLWNMQHGKCCYSEMKIPEEGHGKAVEHFRPRSIFKWQKNQWDNLLLVCPQCNGRKSDQFPVMLTRKEGEAKIIYSKKPPTGTPAILNPSDPTTDPEEHLTYILDVREPLYGQIVPRNGSPQGRETIRVTGIDESFFLRERQYRAWDVLLTTYRNILRASESGDDDARDAWLESFRQHMDSRAAFAGLAREFARQHKLDEKFGLAIPGPGLGG